MAHLDEEAIQKFESEDAAIEKELYALFLARDEIKKRQRQLHADFRAAYRLNAEQSNIHHIADWRWRQKHDCR